MSRATLLLSSVLVLVVLMAILVLNAVRLPSRQLQVAPIDAAPMDEAGAVERLRQALRFRTISFANPQNFNTEPFLALRDYFEEAFPGVHAALEREIVGGYSLLYRWKGSDASRRPILLMSHIDVVPVEAAALDNWSHPPFEGVVAGDFVWGRSALDAKRGTVGILEAAELLFAEARPPQSYDSVGGRVPERAGAIPREWKRRPCAGRVRPNRKCPKISRSYVSITRMLCSWASS